MQDPGFFWALFAMTWIFACAVVLIVIWHLRSKRRIEQMSMIHQERMRAIEKGIPLPEFPDLSEEANMQRFDPVFTPPKLNPRWPLGLGALIAMAGAGFMMAGLLAGDPDFGQMWSLGVFGIFIGFGFVLYYFLTRSTRDK